MHDVSYEHLVLATSEFVFTVLVLSFVFGKVRNTFNGSINLISKSITKSGEAFEDSITTLTKKNSELKALRYLVEQEQKEVRNNISLLYERHYEEHSKYLKILLETFNSLESFTLTEERKKHKQAVLANTFTRVEDVLQNSLTQTQQDLLLEASINKLNEFGQQNMVNKKL